MYNIDKCIIKQKWCGDGNIPPNKAKYYSGIGTRNECMKKGFGAGMYSEKRKGLPINSLQQISYVGDKMEQNFINNGINDLIQLKNNFGGANALQKEIILKNTLINKDNTLNKKAYNSVIMWLYNQGVGNLPSCKNT